MIYQEIVCKSLIGNAFLSYNKPDYTWLAGSIIDTSCFEPGFFKFHPVEYF